MPLDRCLAVLSVAAGTLAFGGALLGSASIATELADRPVLTPAAHDALVVGRDGGRRVVRVLHRAPDHIAPATARSRES